MQPSHSDVGGHIRYEAPDRRPQWSPDTPTLPRSASTAGRLRSEDSWIEISSQPSSSSLSSAGDQEVVTTGLQVQHGADAHRHRRRRVNSMTLAGVRQLRRPTSAAGSSQDEYEESDSESDKILSSSNEDLDSRKEADAALVALQPAEQDEDDNLTAIGCGTFNNRVFTPQPNAFTYPPLIDDKRSAGDTTAMPNSSFPMAAGTASAPSTRPTYPHTSTRNARSSRPTLPHARSAHTISSHSPYNVIAPSHSYQPDHDAALRASLSTLLSCAAAVRGSAKLGDRPTPQEINREKESTAQPTLFRLVPESQLHGRTDENASRPSSAPRNFRPALSTSSASLSSSPRQMATAKRKAREQSKDRHTKKSRGTARSGSSMDDMTISPTLMSWMISAGVVLVFSAISFSAGYAWGKEVGRFEGAAGLGNGGVSCGREAIRPGTGLRRLRWSAGSTSATV